MKENNLASLFLAVLAMLATLITMVQGMEYLTNGIDFGAVILIGTVLVGVGIIVLRWGYLHLAKTGIINFSSEFTEDEKAWDQAKKSLIYVGVTGFSITERFLAWHEKNLKNLPREIRFYLVSPDDAESLRTIASHRAGREAATAEVERLSEEVKAAFGKLQTCTGVEVNFYRVTSDFIPVWMYIIDGDKIYLGFPAPGKTGMNSPTYLCHKRADKYGLFDVYAELIGRLGKEDIK